MAILIVDDEEHDIELLQRMLRRCRLRVDYVSSSADAVDAMKEYQSEHGRPYCALITDFNMDDITGKQLLQIVTGRLEELAGEVTNITSFDNIPDIALREHIAQNFDTPAEYSAFVRSHAGLVKVLQSSNTYGDGVNDLPPDVEFFHKSNGSEEIIQYLRDNGIVKNRKIKLHKN